MFLPPRQYVSVLHPVERRRHGIYELESILEDTMKNHLPVLHTLEKGKQLFQARSFVSLQIPMFTA